MKRKGIILAGGHGRRLYPITKVISKHLLPVYDKPMIYYPLSVLMLAGIEEVLVITTPEHNGLYRALLGDGDRLGIKISYEEQPQPEGLAQALIIAEKFLSGAPSALILGDNIFHGNQLQKILQRADRGKVGATIFTYSVGDPQNYGVAEIGPNGNVISIEEKPIKPKSNNVVTGLYFYDADAVKLAKTIEKSSRNELEITDLNRLYLDNGNLQHAKMGRGFSWLDMGTHEGRVEASSFIRTIQNRQGYQVCCPEEIAFRNGWIDKRKLRAISEEYRGSTIGSYLKKLLEEDFNT